MYVGRIRNIMRILATTIIPVIIRLSNKTFNACILEYSFLKSTSEKQVQYHIIYLIVYETAEPALMKSLYFQWREIIYR